MAHIVSTPTDKLAAYGPLVADRVPAGFESALFEHIAITPMAPTIGAEVSGVRLNGDVGPEVLEELRRALLEWKMLVFRDQDIDRAEHRAFAELWGELEQHPFFKYTEPGQTDVDVATLAKGMDVVGNENNWHNDVTWHTRPSFAAVLRAVELPPVGGDTLWADTGAAYDLLPADIKERIDPLVAEHDWMSAFGINMDKDAVDQLRPAFPPCAAPSGPRDPRDRPARALREHDLHRAHRRSG